MGPELDAVVVGAGVVGLACGAALARCGQRVVVLERHADIAQEISSHNSQVIHAGIYYPTGSLKAKLCSLGREQLYQRCRDLRIAHAKLGKVIVAVEEDETQALEALCDLGTANGAPGLELLDAHALHRVEPQVRAHAALFSPRTGIVDAHGLCLSFAAELEAHGGVILTRSTVVGAERAAPGFRVAVQGTDPGVQSVRCAALVNAAGLGAGHLVAMLGLDAAALGYRLYPCKGDYFAIAPGAPIEVRGLVYPLHGQAGLGIHVTRDLGGRLRLGPDASYLDANRPDAFSYEVDAGKASRFAEAAARYLPGIRSTWLSPDGSGIRPKLAGPGEAFRDFVVAEESANDCPGLVSLLGIESPGLTAATAIADRVVALLPGL